MKQKIIQQYANNFCRRMNGLFKTDKFEWRFYGFQRIHESVIVCFGYGESLSEISIENFHGSREYLHRNETDFVLIKKKYLDYKFSIKSSNRDLVQTFRDLKEAGF